MTNEKKKLTIMNQMASQGIKNGLVSVRNFLVDEDLMDRMVDKFANMIPTIGMAVVSGQNALVLLYSTLLTSVVFPIISRLLRKKTPKDEKKVDDPMETVIIEKFSDAPTNHSINAVYHRVCQILTNDHGQKFTSIIEKGIQRKSGRVENYCKPCYTASTDICLEITYKGEKIIIESLDIDGKSKKERDEARAHGQAGNNDNKGDDNNKYGPSSLEKYFSRNQGGSLRLRSAKKATIDEFILNCDDRYCDDRNSTKVEPTLKYYKYDGRSWKDTHVVVKKTFNNTFLSKENMSKVMTFLKSMTSSKAKYEAAGASFKMAILAYGPPGTGKTALAFALSNYLQRDLYHVNMAGIRDVGAVMSSIPKKVVLLMDEFDACDGIHQRDVVPQVVQNSQENNNNNSESRVVKIGGGSYGRDNLFTMLDILDGYDGQLEETIIVFTTNHPEHLDSALLRPGRMNLKIELSFAEPDQIKSIFESIMKTPFDESKMKYGYPKTLSPARWVNQIILPYHEHPEIIYTLLNEFAHVELENGLEPPPPKPQFLQDNLQIDEIMKELMASEKKPVKSKKSLESEEDDDDEDDDDDDDDEDYDEDYDDEDDDEDC